MSVIDQTDADAPDPRGRLATRPRHIPLKGWWDILRRVFLRLTRDQLGLIAAGVAFYALLAVFPTIAAMTALAGLVTDPGAIVFQMDQVAGLLPEEAEVIVLDQANAVAGQADGDLTFALIISVGIAIYVAMRATTSLIHGLNVAYSEVESRGIFRKIGLDVLLTAGLLFGGLLMLALLVILPAVLAFVPLGLEVERMVSILRWVILAVVFISGLAVLYRFGPDRRNAKWRWLTPGATFAGVLWFSGSYGFTYYVANFASYNETFGSLGGVIILLTWLWLSSFIILIGATLDAEIEAQTARDSTVGPDLPMGERGATKADTLGKTF